MENMLRAENKTRKMMPLKVNPKLIDTFTLKHKYDFCVFVTVDYANPNGNPDNNLPRTDMDDYGMITDVCVKHKIRNVYQIMGQENLVQTPDRAGDGCDSIEKRARLGIPSSLENPREIADAACAKWADVRAFGGIMTWLSKETIGIRGPVTLCTAKSLDPVIIQDLGITKCIQGKADGKGADTMGGSKDVVEYGVYRITGAISPLNAAKTGFTDDDAEMLKMALMHLFEGDASAARPEGSMEVRKMYWWKHEEPFPATSSARIIRNMECELKDGIDQPRRFEDYEITWNPIDGCVEPEIYEA